MGTTKHSWIKRKERYGNTGSKNPEETRKKLSIAFKGHHPISEWKKGYHPVNEFKKGYKMSEETKEKIRRYHLGKKLSLEHRKKLMKPHKNWIKGGHSEETKNKMSKTRKERMKSGEIKLPINSFKKGHKSYWTEETKKKYKESVNTPEYKRLRRKIRENIILPSKDTSIEVKIQNFLETIKIDYFKHKYMNIEHGYQCDIFIPSLNLVIECDGDYWHKYPTGREIDHIRTSELIEKGFKVIRLWERDIKIMQLEDFNKMLVKENP